MLKCEGSCSVELNRFLPMIVYNQIEQIPNFIGIIYIFVYADSCDLQHFAAWRSTSPGTIRSISVDTHFHSVIMLYLKNNVYKTRYHPERSSY